MAEAFSLGGMLLGASSAATQVEGGDKNNNWYDWYRRGNIKDGSDPSVATMHWERWQEDAELMAGMGLQCCRLGLEWSRIEPERGVFDESAVQHYIEELKFLSERGIKPLVTLGHFSNPLWLERSGGFLARGARRAFLEYVEYIVPRLAPYVDCWITLNEPNVYAVNGYMSGEWPPGVKSIPAALMVMDALVPCHIEAYKLIHRLVPDARVSFANHLRVFAPENPKNPAHAAAARASAYLFQTAMTRAMMTGRAAPPFQGRGHGRYYDYIAINYYTRSTCSGLADGVRANSPRNDLGWEIYPEGLAELCVAMWKEYGAPVYITENGTCDLEDSFRCRYLYEHLRAAADCGAPVERYYHWCFCDNFEWIEGNTARFGLVHVDYATQERRIKRSGEFYAKLIENGGVTQEMYDEYVAQQVYNVR